MGKEKICAGPKYCKKIIKGTHQRGLNNFTITDDYALGSANDQTGKEYYVAKNS